MAKLRFTDENDGPLLVLARGYAHIWGGEEKEPAGRYTHVTRAKTPTKLDMGNVDALILPGGTPTAWHALPDGGLLLRREAGDGAELLEAALALPSSAWKKVACRMTGGDWGAILVFRSANSGRKPNLRLQGLRCPVEKKSWPHRMYDVSVARVKGRGTAIRLKRAGLGRVDD